MKPYPSGDFLFLSLSTTYSRNIDIQFPKLPLLLERAANAQCCCCFSERYYSSVSMLTAISEDIYIWCISAGHIWEYIWFVLFQALVTTATQSPVVIAPQPSVLKTATTLSSTVPITCGDIAKVGQLVSSMYTCYMYLNIDPFYVGRYF